MEVRAGYKRTDVGVIPRDWNVIVLKTLGLDISDGNYSSKYPKSSEFRASGVPFIRANNIRNMGVVDDDLRFISESLHAELQKGHLRKNDILITTRGEIGQIAFVPDRHIGSNINAQLVRINPGRAQLDHRFLGFILAFGNAQKQFDNLQTGSALKQLPVNRLTALEIPLPPTKAEQEAIAEALSDADALIESLEQLLAKKRQLKQGAMPELLTGKKRLPGFSGEWEVKPLGDLAEIIMGQSPDSKYYNRRGEGVPLVQGNADIESHRSIARVWTTEVTKEGRTGDLLLTVRAPVGAVGRISEDCCLGRGVCSLRPKCDRDFLFHALVLAERAWKMLEQGSTFTSANSTQVAAFLIPVSSDSTEQAAIAAILSDLDAEIAALEAKLAKARRLKQGMMQELLTGRIRLV